MSIHELIDKLCPSGVPTKRLWELTTWDKKFNAVAKHKQPNTNPHKYLLASELRALKVEGGDVKLLNTGMEDFGYTSAELAGDALAEGEIIALPWGGTPSVQYFKGKYVTADNRIATSQDVGILSVKYLYYYLRNNLRTIETFYRGSGIKHPSMANVLDVCVPLPPMEVQLEIVRILDAMTSLQAELQAELVARQKQFGFYRNSLLTFDAPGAPPVRWTTLGEACIIKAGKQVSKVDISDSPGPYPVINSGRDPLGFIDRFNTENDELGITSRGAGVGSVLWTAGKYFRGNLNYSTTVRSGVDLDNRFLFHWLISHQLDIQKLATYDGIPALNKVNLEKLVIPLPTRPDQGRIVKILDKFDALTNDLSLGLPAEIEARRKQYEYYRDKLLTFDELAA